MVDSGGAQVHETKLVNQPPMSYYGDNSPFEGLHLFALGLLLLGNLACDVL